MRNNTQTVQATSPLDIAKGGYTSALAAFKAALAGSKEGLAAGDAAKTSVKDAERAVCWAAFDVVCLLPQGERREAGASYGEQIATQREGVKEASVRKYRQRFANACDTHAEQLTGFDAEKRGKVDPMSAVATIERANAKANKKTEAEAQRAAFAKAHGAEALRIAAATYEPPMMGDDFAALLISGDPSASERFAHALDVIREREAFAKSYGTWQERNRLRDMLRQTEEADAKAFEDFKANNARA